MDKRLYSNGFLIRRKDMKYYQGVEGDCWPLAFHENPMEHDEVERINGYLETEVFRSWGGPQWVDLCPNWNIIKQYYKACEKNGIETVILFCETNREYPNAMETLPDLNRIFLGYDWAYPGGSYYSCIANDIGRIPEFGGIRLNTNGLPDHIDELINFIELRENLKAKYPFPYFEAGGFESFAIYKVWKVTEDIV